MNDNGRDYKVRVRLVDGNEINARISNAAGPVSALMMFLSENDKAKMDMIQFLEIVDTLNNQIVQTTEANQQVYLH